MGLILDLAVAALALLVIGSLALLAWTLGVGAVAAVRDERRRIEDRRRSVRAAEERIHAGASRASVKMAELTARIRSTTSGDRPEA